MVRDGGKLDAFSIGYLPAGIGEAVSDFAIEWEDVRFATGSGSARSTTATASTCGCTCSVVGASPTWARCASSSPSTTSATSSPGALSSSLTPTGRV